MTDYIDREVPKRMLSTEKFCATCPGLDEPGGGCAECVADYIESLPAADVAPVRRGKWGCYEPLSDGYRCSSCKLIHRNCTAYCPNCGAKMEV